MDAAPNRAAIALRALLHGLAVLVVDDAADVRDAIGFLLEDLGARVVTAQDGAEALDRLSTERPDLILCDLRMPRVDGYQFIRELRANGRLAHLPVVALSAVTGGPENTPTSRAGFDAFLAKPFDHTDLSAALLAAACARLWLFRQQCKHLRQVAAGFRTEAKHAVALSMATRAATARRAAKRDRPGRC